VTSTSQTRSTPQTPSNHQHHHPDDPRNLHGVEAMKTFAAEFREAFPDFHDSIDIQIAEGDMHGGYSLHL
jgi:hypothetical protein